MPPRHACESTSRVRLNPHRREAAMRCRYFYRPEATIFGTRTAGEVYASRRLEEGVALRRVRGRCVVQYSGGAVEQCSIAGGMGGGAIFVCRFFYDHVAESLSKADEGALMRRHS
eukprot:1455662-Pyramimonas_sp.AAC.1